jgi:uncharacterized protein YkwD
MKKFARLIANREESFAITRSRAVKEAVVAAAMLLLCGALRPAAAAATSAIHSLIESEVVAELNRARTHPAGYAAHLRELRGSFRDRFTYVDGEVVFATQEGTTVVDEAIAFLLARPAVPGLKESRALALAARDHMLDQSLHGGVGHRGSDGSDPLGRIMRFGRFAWESALIPARRKLTAGEIIGYGRQEARDIVVLLIVDDGVPDRGHRLAIFNPAYTQVGVSFGRHAVYDWACVIDFADALLEKRPQ